MVEPPRTAGRACIIIGPAYLPLLDDPPEKQPPVVLVEGNRGSAKTRSIFPGRNLLHNGSLRKNCLLTGEKSSLPSLNSVFAGDSASRVTIVQLFKNPESLSRSPFLEKTIASDGCFTSLVNITEVSWPSGVPQNYGMPVSTHYDIASRSVPHL